jgi:hypothetical protein
MKKICQFILAAAAICSPALAAAPEQQGHYDIVVYGDSSGAVIAALAAKREGRSVIWVNPTGFAGGMSASGLGATDFLGRQNTFGGLAKEFYAGVAAAYGVDFVRSFEPHVGKRVFEQMLKAAGVTVVYNEKLDRTSGKGVTMDGKRITAITTLSSKTYRGKMFIDTTYVGDLMAAAGVTYTVGREPENQYGESIAGVRRGDTKPRVHYRQGDKDHFVKDVDPYVKPGDPTSGLLPHIHKIEGLQNGHGDKKIQAYNYRVCLTTNPDNRIPIEKPAGYREIDHELLLRNFDAGDTRLPALVEPLAGTGQKVDWNNMHAVGSDFVGANWDYPEASYERRREIEKEHETYIRGFLWTMANNPRVPEAIRKRTATYGLPKDEFTDNGGWPWMIYIREARRMVSDYVMTQLDCAGQRTAPDPVALGSFGMDSHGVQHIVTDAGKVQNEGVIWHVPPRPYGISYRAIIPKKGQCENLLSPICLSASHVAHGSIRMEPVFMALGQSAAIIAGLALDKNVSVQDVPYPALLEKLLAAKQIVRPDAGQQTPAPKQKGIKKKKSPSVTGAARSAPPAVAIGETAPTCFKAYYTRLPFDDHGFTGKYADIVVELPQRGRFVFSREFGYQPRWLPSGGKPQSVTRLIPRKGDGPDERPDNHNIACHAAIVAQTEASATIHWRYAPDITKQSFTDFLAAYNRAGTPAPFYADYADEYFTIHADGKVVRTVKNGCQRLADWNDPGNQIEQTLEFTPDGIREIALRPAQLSRAAERPVTGSPVKSGRTDNLVRHWRFDEGAGLVTAERQSGKVCDIGGAAAYWRPGVSGTCLSFDSYSTVVTSPASQPSQLKDDFTVSAWIALQEYPFNLAAILEHMEGKAGFLLGVNARGQVEFRIGNGDAVQSVVTERVPLYEWVHVAAVAKRGASATVYLNGKPVATTTNAAAFIEASNAGYSIGMTRSLRQFPLFAERAVTKQFQTAMVFSGLMDEVQLFDKALSSSEVGAEHAALKPAGARPLQPWVLPAGPETSPGFRAEYTKLRYSSEWDGLWRVGDSADIVVTFADKPWRYVFWRGTRCLPSLVTGYGRDGIWSNDQGPERYDKQCYEHMSDMLCRFSNARLIHRSDARVMVHWRNASASIAYQWPAKDANGWGLWTDEYWTIYPDGISIRHQLVHNNTDKNINCELNQNEILCQPGQATEDVIHDEGVILLDPKGQTRTISRTSPPAKKGEGDWNLQFINLKGRTKQFEIGEIGAYGETCLHRDVWWRGWNHYPVQLIPSDGTRVTTYDRPSSTCPATFRELRHTNGNNIEAMVMYGLTDRQPGELTALNRSWNFAPAVTDTNGCVSLGYEQRERAFKFVKTAGPLGFTLRASKERPLENPAFVIANWGSPDSSVSLKINGQAKTRGVDYRAGIEVDTNGTYALVLWLPLSATKPVSFEFGDGK